MDLIDASEFINPNPNDALDSAAYKLCQLLHLRPHDLSERSGFAGDYNLNWARDVMETTLASRAALEEFYNK